MLTNTRPVLPYASKEKENTELAAVLRRDHDPHSNE
jgi:hypothetical protein